MTTNHFLCGIIAASILSGPASMMAAAKTQILSEPTEIQGVPCQGKVELGENGRIAFCTLSRDYTVAGYALPAGTTVRFSGSSQAESFVLGKQATIEGFMLPAGSEVRIGWAFTCTLREDALIRGVPLPAGSTIFFKTPKGWESEVPDTWHCWLPKDTIIQGHLCGSTEDGCGIIFYPSGKLRAAGLAKDVEIDGVPCTSSHNPFRMGMRVLFYGLDVRAWFYESGRLAQGMVSRDCSIAGRSFKPGDIVRLTPEGTLDPTGTTLGAASRRADKRTPPQSH
ncbi:MAG: hypothetical protein WCR49_02260 [Opitutae bacterium]